MRRADMRLVVVVLAWLAGATGPAVAGDLGRCSGFEVDGVRLPVASTTCDSLSPGAAVRVGGVTCTLNFRFAGSDGSTYMGTAGHCVVKPSTDATWSPGSGPDAFDARGMRIGEIAFASFQSWRFDFALVRLDSEVPASAAVAHWGGPTGMNDDLVSSPVVLRHYGQGIGFSAVVPARTAAAFAMPCAHEVHAAGLAEIGDSGSPVISDDGRAVGVVVAVEEIINPSCRAFGHQMSIFRLGPQLARAEAALGIDLVLETAALR